MDTLITLHIFAEDYDQTKSWELTRWCLAQGADEWTLSAIGVEGDNSAVFEQFDSVTQVFRRSSAGRRNMSATNPNDFVRATELWTLDDVSFPAFKTFLPDGLFTYRSDSLSWFEDPALYRRGELMLGVVSHEQEGILRVTDREQRLLERAGFPFKLRGAYVGH